MADFDTDEKCEAWIKEHGIEAFRRNATAPLGFGGRRRQEAQAYLARLEARDVAERQRQQDLTTAAQVQWSKRSVRWAIAGVAVAVIVGVATIAVTKGWV
ncbi:hypothetical protein ACQ4P5_07400 [Ralstonia sp. L16]|uniref:hypothetical protein n=1 Tax=Ralstonia sp. L16 TaxID=3423950 RepID=UPI003F798211